MTQPQRADLIVNVEQAEEVEHAPGEPWHHFYRVLTPSMRPRGGSLGVCINRVPPGKTACPFHAHQREDEVFYVLSGRGVLRYGEALYDVSAGDCVSCPAGTGVAHQLANTGEEDLVYLAIGPFDPHEVCTYPDSGKVLVRSLRRVGYLSDERYVEGEPDVPRILELARSR